MLMVKTCVRALISATNTRHECKDERPWPTALLKKPVSPRIGVTDSVSYEGAKKKAQKSAKKEATRHQRCGGRTQHQRCDGRPQILTPTMWWKGLTPTMRRKGNSHQRCGGWETHTNDAVDGRDALEALLLDDGSEFQLLLIRSFSLKPGAWAWPLRTA